MSYDKLQSEILAVRDAREAALHSISLSSEESLVFVSTAIPGANKSPSGSVELLMWVLQRIPMTFGEVRCHTPLSRDLLGPYTIFSVTGSLQATKRTCVEIEMSHPATRLLDLDVYATDFTRVGRTELGMAPRSCLLCHRAATECIRLRRHDQDSLIEHTTKLLESFTASPVRISSG